MVKATVIIPIYNTEKYVERAILSVLNQSYTDFELLLIDDGSTDHTASVCQKCAAMDNRIRYIYQDNLGEGGARNRGLAEAKGEYILFCDSDDTWNPNLLEEVMNVFESKECDLVRFGSESKNQEVYKSEVPDEGCFSQHDIIVEYFENGKLYRNLSSGVWGAYKREIIEKNGLKYTLEMASGLDSMFVMEYLLCCKNIYFIGKQLYVYYPTFEDRVNSTARHIKIYYNEYELCELLFKAIYTKWNSHLSEEEKEKVYAGFYDKVIGRLVRFAAYSSEVTREKDIAHLEAFLLKPYVIEAGKYYKRKRETDSRIVPFLMRRKNIHLLWLVLRSKKNNYYKLYGKKRYAASLWKKDPLVEI